MSIVLFAQGCAFYEGKLLIVKRAPHKFLGGKWEMPGGKPEPEDTLTECIEREFREETGLKAKVIRPYHTYSDVHDGKEYHGVAYHMRLSEGIDGLTLSEEHTEHAFVSENDLGQYDLSDMERRSAHEGFKTKIMRLEYEDHPNLELNAAYDRLEKLICRKRPEESPELDADIKKVMDYVRLLEAEVYHKEFRRLEENMDISFAEQERILARAREYLNSKKGLS